MKKQKSGLYRTKLKIGTLPDGKPLYKWLSSTTRAGLEEEKRKARAYYIDGTASAEDQLFGAYAIQWLNVRKAPHLSPATLAGYRSSFRRYLLPEFGDRNIRAIKPMEIQRFVNGLAGRSDTLIHTCIAALRGVFASAVQDQILILDPTRGLVKAKATAPKVKRALTPAERARLEAVVAVHPDGLFGAILYWLGLRSGEARGLRWADIDWTHARVRIERDVDQATGDHVGELKTPASARTLPIPAPLMGLLRAQRGLPGAYILHGKHPGTPMTDSMATRRWALLRDAVGLPPEITPHWLRHNYATMCRDAGLRAEDTMYLMGHSSYQTTLSVYTHVTDRRLDELAEAAVSIFKSCTEVAQASKGDPEK